MQELKILVGDKVFEFFDFDDWCDTASKKFSNAGLSTANTICVDSLGRICLSGKEFMRARDEGTWPIKVFPSRCG
jgi:hypothetical protein